jgi:2-dehydropantoate 2-reductase
VQDLVVIAVKGPALGAVAERIGPLIGPHTLLMPAMNGVPWWFAAGAPALGTAPLDSIDPGGRIAAALPLGQVIGCVVHASTFTPEPGLVEHKMGQGLIVGEPLGGVSGRVQALAARLQQAGFETTASADVRRDIWFKLWGNMTMNPLTAITGATIDRILADRDLRDFCSAAMREAAAIGERIGCPIDQSPEDRHAVTAKLGAFRTSMLQDAAAGRAIELDSIVGAVQELGQSGRRAHAHGVGAARADAGVRPRARAVPRSERVADALRADADEVDVLEVQVELGDGLGQADHRVAAVVDDGFERQARGGVGQGADQVAVEQVHHVRRCHLVGPQPRLQRQLHQGRLRLMPPSSTCSRMPT